MQISSYFRSAGVWAPPILFGAAALSLASLHLATHEKRLGSTSASMTEDAFSVDAAMSPRFRDLVATARKGDLAARLEVAKGYTHGQGVARNEARAAIYYQLIVNEFGEADARDARAQQIAVAFRSLAQLYRDGAAQANIPPNPVYAFSLFHHAASYFGDPAAQYELARLLLSGHGVANNPKVAAQWLLSASRKGYAPAQARLGELLWHGEKGIIRMPGNGLGLLAVAYGNASPEDKPWISNMFEAARAEASSTEILEANAFIAQESAVSRFLRTEVITGPEAPKRPPNTQSGTNTAAAGRRYLFRTLRARAALAMKQPAVQRPSGPISSPDAVAASANAAASIFGQKGDASTPVSFARETDKTIEVSR
jgi:TPR repeat protein